MRTSVLVAPASLLANWASEIARLAPSLRTLVAHPSAMTSAELQAPDTDRLTGVDLVITSYGALMTIKWRLAVLDEAQAIKNPGARQTRAAKQLDARARLTPSGLPAPALPITHVVPVQPARQPLFSAQPLDERLEMRAQHILAAEMSAESVELRPGEGLGRNGDGGRRSSVHQSTGDCYSLSRQGAVD